jgi:DNA-binding beta-propeller fold protein YncE
MGYRIAVGIAAIALAASASGTAAASAEAAIVVVRGTGAVRPISLGPPTAGMPIPIPVPGFPYNEELTPTAIAITPDGSTAYVASAAVNPSVVTPVDLNTGTAERPIAVPTEPSAVAITPNGKTLYVASSGPSGELVTPVNIATGVAGPQLSVRGDVGPIAVSPSGRTVWVASWDSRWVYLTPISTKTKTIGARFEVGSGHPLAMSITPNGRLLYMTSYGEVIHVKLFRHTHGRVLIGGTPTSIAINPSGTQVDVVDQDSTVVPITVATNTAGAPIQVASGVFGLAWGPAGKTVWVTDLNAVPGQVGGSLIPVDGATVKPGIPAGSAPDSVAITPDQPPVARFSVEPARH